VCAHAKAEDKCCDDKRKTKICKFIVENNICHAPTEGEIKFLGVMPFMMFFSLAWWHSEM
jgi:hypothetical protein